MSDKNKFILLIITIWILYFGAILGVLIEKKIITSSYIQNLEEKLNIYERSYEEFCLEDSLRQVE